MGQSAGIVGTLLSAVGKFKGGEATQSSANYTADQLLQAGGQSMASAERGALDQTKRADLVASTVQARAAASGAGASDPTVTGIISKIAEEGQYRSLLALNKGQVANAEAVNKANAVRAEGQNAMTAGRINAIGTVLKPEFGTNLQTLWNKYGAGGPKNAPWISGYDLEAGTT
jgi:hypothetical protein